jgi:hypothetical protein
VCIYRQEEYGAYGVDSVFPGHQKLRITQIGGGGGGEEHQTYSLNTEEGSNKLACVNCLCVHDEDL